jgi:uracil-DNA glycosylase
MPDDAPLPSNPAELNAALRRHLASLQAAGVEWLPNAAPPRGTSLFAEPEAAAEPADPLAGRRLELQVLAERVSGCTRCADLASTRTQTVFGVGPLEPELCLVGEAPGADEDRQGEPFVGAAGQLLNRILAACGLLREQVYICNILKCRPPKNRAPLAEEADNCSEYLRKQIELVRPRFLCLLGSTPLKYLLNSTRSISSMRQKLHNYEGIPVVCTYHPAYLLPHRSDDPKVLHERKKLVWEDMKFLMTQMGRPVQQK